MNFIIYLFVHIHKLMNYEQNLSRILLRNPSLYKLKGMLSLCNVTLYRKICGFIIPEYYLRNPSLYKLKGMLSLCNVTLYLIPNETKSTLIKDYIQQLEYLPYIGKLKTTKELHSKFWIK